MTKLEKVTNICLIVAALVVIAAVVKNHYPSWFRKPYDASSSVKEWRGQKLPMPGLAGKSTSIVLVLSSHCHFCNEAMPFFRKLASLRDSSHGRVRLVAVLPDSQEDAQRYLTQNNLAADDVLSMKLKDINVRGTPMLLLVDPHGTVQGAWIGVVAESRQPEVFFMLKELCPTCESPRT